MLLSSNQRKTGTAPFFAHIVRLILLLGLSGCEVPTVALTFSPSADPGISRQVEKGESAKLLVVPFSDDREVPKSYGDLRLIGWGMGTGAIKATGEIDSFVTQSVLREMDLLGIRGQLKTLSGSAGSVPKNREIFQGGYPEDSTILSGKILHYEFRVDHPRMMNGGGLFFPDMLHARIRTFVTLEFNFVEGGTTVWKGTISVNKEFFIRSLRPLKDRIFAQSILSRSLSLVIKKAVSRYESHIL